jgi:N-acylneuraminate cytidylyltransferase
LESHNLDSLLSAVRTKRFFWNASGEPLNYDYNNRPRRQDFEGLFMENGAFYINSVENILKFKNRLSGKVGVYEMPEASGFEIDEPEDWIIVESLLQRQQQTSH